MKRCTTCSTVNFYQYIWDFLKEIAQLVFRMLPFPTRPRLIVFGCPDRNAPVLVTTNYDLTVRRVTKALKGQNCYLLVAPAKGIDVWCAAGGRYFSAESILSIIKTSGIEKLVDHRNLILPQLSANGLNLSDVRRKTGWNPMFGPVYAKDIPAFLANNYVKTKKMSRIKFGFLERLEAGVVLAINVVMLLFIPVLFMGKMALVQMISTTFFISILINLLAFWLPGKPGFQKGASLGIFLVIIGWGWGYPASIGYVSLSDQLIWSLCMFSLAVFIGYDQPYWSPIWSGNMKRILTGAVNIQHMVDETKCTGCGICADVCPTGCMRMYQKKAKAYVSNLSLCEECKACLVQCPSDAIVSSMHRDTDCGCFTCGTINIAQSLIKKKGKEKADLAETHADTEYFCSPPTKKNS